MSTLGFERVIYIQWNCFLDSWTDKTFQLFWFGKQILRKNQFHTRRTRMSRLLEGLSYWLPIPYEYNNWDAKGKIDY